MSTMERILRLMAEKKASDVYLSAHAPATIKINGQCLPINNQLLPPEAPKALLTEVLPAHRITELEETGELNMAHAIEGDGTMVLQPTCRTIGSKEFEFVARAWLLARHDRNAAVAHLFAIAWMNARHKKFE